MNTSEKENKSIKHYIPNTLTGLRASFALIILGLLFLPHSLALAQLLIVGGVVSDKLDGTLARAMNVESDLGKRMESLADPFFAFSSILYVVVFREFPESIFWAGTIGLLIGSLGRVLVKRMTGKMFYEKSQITRVAVGLIFLTIIAFLFEIPYREAIAWIVLIFGYGAGVNYFRMMVQFTRKEKQTEKHATKASI